jgi:hypothetical protein
LEPATIRIFLVQGIPDGLRTAEISNWTGKAIACPRSQLGDLLAREEITNPGVYFLTGTDPESGKRALYIGEAESVGKRLKGHSDKDYWVNAVVFVSKDENLTKAHVKYLEGKLISRANEIGKARLYNSASSGARLPEPDTAEMDVFLEKVYQLLPVLGVDLFSPVEATPSDERRILFCKIKGLVAKGRRTPNGFVVLKGSQAVLKHRPSAKWTKKKREDLMDSGVLVQEDDHYIFSRDFEFGSPSTAGSAIRGGATNGLTAWKTSDGKTLKHLEKELEI